MHQKTSGLAIGSLVLSILSVFIGPFGCVPGIVCGHLARRQITAQPNLGGEGLATAGLVIGYIFLTITVIALLLLLSLQAAR